MADRRLQVFHAVAVAPELLDGQGDADMVLGNDSHFVVDAGL